ncbi:MAG: hypothetical protein LUG47_07640 [Clostridiales bacterium]|nr:hypothetical protein [Clostridiales bacterium]
METNTASPRDASLDYLKCIALLGLVIAHVSTNEFLLQARVFDVNLLVIISAMLGCRGLEQHSMENGHKYIYIYWTILRKKVFPPCFAHVDFCDVLLPAEQYF